MLLNLADLDKVSRTFGPLPATGYAPLCGGSEAIVASYACALSSRPESLDDDRFLENKLKKPMMKEAALQSD